MASTNSTAKLTFSAPVAILAGSVLISLSILISGGVISVKTKNNNDQNQPANVVKNAGAGQPQAGQPQTEADIVKNLKTYAGKLGLDQNKFNSCLDSGQKATAVSSDTKDGSQNGVNGTPSFFVNGRPLFIGASPFSEFKKVIDEELNNSAGTVDRKNITNGDLPVLGNTNAPVTLIEFSDYQCPFCERFFNGAEAQIKKEYVDTGKVKVYFRDFPLTQIHPGAQKAAEAARCASDQGKYWEYHDLIFNNQSSIF
jgi:protein-disulfide isomerase